MLKLLQNRTFIFVLAVVLGLIFGEAAEGFKSLTLPALMVVMTATSIRVYPRDLFRCKKIFMYVWVSFLAQYVLLGGLILLLAWKLMPGSDLWIGYVLVAAAPPGAAVLPFTYIVKGDTNFSFIGTFFMYLAALLVVPLMVFLFAGTAVSPLRVFMVMVQLIIVPVLLSRVIKMLNIVSGKEGWIGQIINWGFFTVIFTVVALNRDVFLSQPHVLSRVFLVIIPATVIMAFLANVAGRKLALSDAERRSLMLLASIKNAGFAAGVALAFFNQETSIPGAVVTAFYALYFIYLGAFGARDSSKGAARGA